MDNKKWMNRLVQAALILFIAVFTFQIILHVNKMQVATKFLNDCHQITSLTELKLGLTLANQDTNHIKKQINNLWSGLLEGTDTSSFDKDIHQGYWSNLQICYSDYKLVEDDLRHYQIEPTSTDNLLESNNKFYQSINDLTTILESYTLGLIENLKIYELFLSIFIVTLIVVYFKQLLIKMKLDRYNGELKILSYFDETTKLPNRRRCRELLSEILNFDKYECYACIMFDLNNLKWVNDTYGHKFGDVLISSFSAILHKYINDEVFIGRYGGDEFIAIITNHDEKKVKQILSSIQDSVDKFNDEHHQIPIKFAYGYDIAYKGNKIKMEEIVERADINMYKCKKRMKDQSSL